MDRNSVDWKGYWAAVPTPFSITGEIDLDAWKAILNMYVEQGVHGVIVNGTAGEWTSQNDEERKKISQVAVETISGRIPVLIGCTTYTNRASVELAKHAKSIGADGVMSTPPPYIRPTSDDLVSYYQDINDQVEIPLVAYNWPRGTAIDIDLETATRIAELSNVVALKNSTGDWIRVVDYIEKLSNKVRIFSSLINRRGIAVMRELGGDGYIDGGALGAPFAVPFFESFWAGDFEKARDYADKWWALTSRLVTADFGGVYGSAQAQLKKAMELLGQPTGSVRLPLNDITNPKTISQLSNVLRECGLTPVK